MSKFQSEADLEIYARQTILGQGDDHEELLCSQTPTMNRNDLRSASSGKSVFQLNGPFPT